MRVTFRSLERWPRPPNKYRRNSPFQAGYADTLTKLEKELGLLGGKNVVIQLALSPRDIRQDGMPRADARKPEHPGVIISFDSRRNGHQVAFLATQPRYNAFLCRIWGLCADRP